MDKDLNYSIKIDGKWQTIIARKKNKWGNYQLSINKKLLMQQLRDGESDWLNLSEFVNEPKIDIVEPDPKLSKQKTSEFLNDDIPF